MERRSVYGILGLVLCCLAEVIAGDINVSAPLHGTVQLPCHFPFIKGEEGLTVVWMKTLDDGSQLEVHTFRDGQDDFSMQDPRYSGSTALSGVSHGDLSLTLRNVSSADAGTYACRGANHLNFNTTAVKLSITEPERSLWKRGIFIAAAAVAVVVTLLDGLMIYIIYRNRHQKMANEYVEKFAGLVKWIAVPNKENGCTPPGSEDSVDTADRQHLHITPNYRAVESVQKSSDSNSDSSVYETTTPGTQNGSDSSTPTP
ncbi:myelin-oligodendrocyte glycoprotein-like [Hyperolius riggenbachi]|uniref:myelin-oligodendrocyte glycoprotein-like n=1 Tax=Hyperolius riggenbachi TaxID=752182 RepID=UPI0035A28E55